MGPWWVPSFCAFLMGNWEGGSLVGPWWVPGGSLPSGGFQWGIGKVGPWWVPGGSLVGPSLLGLFNGESGKVGPSPRLGLYNIYTTWGVGGVG